MILLDTWKTAVIPNTEWKSKKKLAIGTKNNDEPNTPTVPSISAISANKMNADRIIMAGDFNRNINNVTLTVGGNNLKLNNVINNNSRKFTCCHGINNKKPPNKNTYINDIKYDKAVDHVLDSKHNTDVIYFNNTSTSRGSDHRPVYVKLKY